MMEKQSLDFIKGYVFSKVEPRIQHLHASKLQKMTPVFVSVPKSWFGLKPIKSELEDLSISARFELLDSLGVLCRSYNTPQSAYGFYINIGSYEEYICFTIEGDLVYAERELTIADIEKKLGYKIKIVGERAKND